MKKINFFAAVATIVVLCTMVLSSCETADDFGQAPKKEEPKNPTPDPTPSDSTKVDPYAWANIMARDLNIDENREVQSKIIAQRNNGEKDSTILRYVLGFELSAPDTVRLPQPGTEMTAYTGMLSFPGKEYTPTTWQNCDSAVVVSTTKGYKTNHYNVIWKTSHVEGWILFKGMWEPYRNSEETTTFSGLSLYRDAYEVVRNDSVYLREEVKHKVDMTFKNRSFSFEKKVVVDHFLKMKEGEKKEEKHNHPAWWGEPIKIIGQGTFVYKPGVGANGQGQFYKNINILFENVLVCMTTTSYVKDSHNPLDFNYSDADIYPLGSNLRGGKITKENIEDWNSAIWRDNKWEPACCTYDHSNYCWTYMSSDKYEQGMTEHLAETCGLKNFAGKHTARLHPSLFYKGEMSNGTLTIKDDNGVAFMSFH